MDLLNRRWKDPSQKLVGALTARFLGGPHVHTKGQWQRQTGKTGAPLRGTVGRPGEGARRALRRRQARQGHTAESERVASAVGAAPWPARLRYLPDSFGTNSSGSRFVLPV